MYNAFWEKITDVFRASLFGRFVLGIVQAIGIAFKSSWFYDFFTSKNMAEVASGSVLASFLGKIFLKCPLTKALSRSRVVRTICSFPEFVMSSPICILSYYFIPASLILFIKNVNNVPCMILMGIFFIASLFIIRIRSTVGQLLSSSLIFSSFCGFFDIKTDYSPCRRSVIMYLCSAFVGIAVGCSSFFVAGEISLIMFITFPLLPVFLDSPLFLLTLTVFSGVLFSTFPAVVLSVLTFFVVCCRLCVGKEKLPKLRTVTIFVILYLCVVLFHTFFGYGGTDGMVSGAVQFLLMLTFFSVITVLNNMQKFNKFIFAVSGCTVVTSVYGIYQALCGLGGTDWADSKVYAGGLGRIVSTFTNPNVYGEYLIIVFCITVVSLFLSEKLFQRLFFIGCLALQLVNLALTYSRGCYVAIAIAVFIIVWCCDKRILSFGILAIPIVPYILPENILTRITSIASYLQDSSVSYRFFIWDASSRLIADNWFVGTGIGATAFASFYGDYMIQNISAQHSHSWFMQILIELSIVGLAVFLLIILFVLKDIAHTLKNGGTKAGRYILVPLIAAIAALVFEGFVDHIFYNNVVFLMFWVVLALIVSGINICDRESADEKLQVVR